MTRQPDPPLFMQHRSTEEYRPQPYSTGDRRVIDKTSDDLVDAAESTRRPVFMLAQGRANTAAGLRQLNEEWGREYFDVPVDAVMSDDAAAALFDGPELVIDAQTHFIAPHACVDYNPPADEIYRSVMPGWWIEMDDIIKRDLAEYISNVFIETETSVAVLTSGVSQDPAYRALFNDEIYGARQLVEQFAGSPRLLNHAIVCPDLPGELERMEAMRDQMTPVGWKVYTPGTVDENFVWQGGWMLDDEEHGLPFMERVRELGRQVVCVHKGISGMVDNGSPRDIGPVAARFPDVNVIVYHSGYELPRAMERDGKLGAVPVEGPYSDEGTGVDRLIKSVNEAGIPAGGNVYAELGTTWFCLIRRPVEAAHVLGKLLKTFGEDNVVWGTDSIFYGSAQPLVDAFRRFQIPDDMCEKFGYEKITPQAKEKILGLNAARLYGIDVAETRRAIANDDLAWARELRKEFLAHRVGQFLR